METMKVDQFQKIVELGKINDFDKFMKEKNMKYFLSGHTLINQKLDKKIGDIITIYKVLRGVNNKLLYMPVFLKLV